MSRSVTQAVFQTTHNEMVGRWGSIDKMVVAIEKWPTRKLLLMVATEMLMGVVMITGSMVVQVPIFRIVAMMSVFVIFWMGVRTCDIAISC